MPVLTLPNAATTPLSVRAKALVFEDAKSRALEDRVLQIAPSQATVLITGETGTGKEIVARHIHELSARRERSFFAVNCGAFSESLVESELFGHERGAFTGAQTSKAGWFEVANGGTLFLDEIGDLPLSMQVKLLRVMQEGEVVRLGSRHAIATDVRLIAATNVDLEDAVAAGKFREDLFYRINVATVVLFPLRERPGDILPLASHFLGVYRQRLAAKIGDFSSSAVQALLEYPWPGNIRELENVIHHALLVARGDRIEVADLHLPRASTRLASGSIDRADLAPSSRRKSNGTPTNDDPSARLDAALVDLFERNVPDLHEHLEERIFTSAYRYCDRNQVQTAKLLGISRNVVRARLIQYGEIVGSVRPPANGAPSASSLVELAETVLAERSRTSSIRVGYQRFALPMLLIKTRGVLERTLASRGLRLEWVEFPGGLQLVDAIRRGEIGLGVVGEGPPIFAQAASVPLVYVAAEASSPESEAIVVHGDSRLFDVADLRGKSIALNKGANVHYLVIRALEEAGVDPRDVEFTFASPESASAAFAERRVDAWAIWDPWLASVQHATGARVLRDGRGLASNTAYYVGTRELAEGRPEVVEVFLAELDRTVAWAARYPEDAAESLAAELGVAEGALAIALRRSSGVRPVGRDLVESQQAIADTFFRAELIQAPIVVRQAAWHRRILHDAPRALSFEPAPG